MVLLPMGSRTFSCLGSWRDHLKGDEVCEDISGFRERIGDSCVAGFVSNVRCFGCESWEPGLFELGNRRAEADPLNRDYAMAPPSRLLSVLLSAAFLAVGCTGPSPEKEESLADLVAAFPSARIVQPTSAIEFGDPGYRKYLVRGWHEDYREIDHDRQATWSTGSSSELEFFIARPRDLKVAIRCGAIARNTKAPHRLGLRLNGEPWAELEIRPGLARYDLLLPGDLQRSGMNRLEIMHPAASETPAPRRKDVRVLWDFMRFEPVREDFPSPFARQDTGRIFVPFDNRIDYFLELTGESSFVVEGIRARGSFEGRLQVALETEDGEEKVLTEDLAAVPGRRVNLPVEPAERVRLSLFALSGREIEDRTAGVVLVRPRVVTAARGAEQVVENSNPIVQLPAAERPNIIVYLVDTLRADHLGCYGYDKQISPRIDDFAGESVLFEGSQAQSPWTRASVASVLTGLWPQVHGAQADEDRLGDKVETLAERLRDLGYRTVGITGNGNAHEAFGFAQGFDYFKYIVKPRPGELLATSEDINEVALGWLDRRDRDQPFFMWLHTIDPHAPYDPPEPFAAKWAGSVEDASIGSMDSLQEISKLDRELEDDSIEKLMALYDAEIAYNDDSFGALLEELRERGLYEDSLIVFLSDHGEEFYDHGALQHGKTLHSEMLDVPLIVRMPRGEGGGRRVRSLVEHVDLLPTILHFLGQEETQGIQGESFLDMLIAGAEETAEAGNAVAQIELRGRKASSLIEEGWKVIVQQDDGNYAYPQLYFRQEDREEKENLAPDRPGLSRYLAARLQAIETATGQAIEGGQISDEELEKLEEELRALGYLD